MAEHYYLIGENSNFLTIKNNYNIFLSRRNQSGLYQGNGRGRVIIKYSKEKYRDFEWILYQDTKVYYFYIRNIIFGIIILQKKHYGKNHQIMFYGKYKYNILFRKE